MRALIACLTASLLVLSPGCDKDKANKADDGKKKADDGKKKADDGKKKADDGKKKGTVAGKALAVAGKAKADAYKPTRFLPPTTQGVFEIDDPAGLFDAHIRPGLMVVPEIAKAFGSAGKESAAIVGSDLTEFKNLTAAVGIDPHAQWGIALLSEVGKTELKSRPAEGSQRAGPRFARGVTFVQPCSK